MLTIFNIVLPVFLVVGAGYAAAKAGIIANVTVDALMKFAQTYAIPCLLFLSIYRLDLGVVFDAE
ncbi:MAG: AEC family transporter, partial [Paracoccaceae bacterium]|nr:AEC family transporter [Paracoccaceae bacterium]